MTNQRKAAGRDPDGSEECSNNNAKNNQAHEENQEETYTDECSVGDLSAYKDISIWHPWANRLDKKTGRLRKLPFDVHSNGAGDVSDPRKWGTLAEAQACNRRIDKPQGGGIGIVLGDHGNFWLGGIDLDSCRDRQSRAIAPWAQEVMAHYPGYWEISPSQTGFKGFFLIDGSACDLRRSKVFKMASRDPSAQHGPQIEFYSAGRWFAVTGQKHGGRSC